MTPWTRRARLSGDCAVTAFPTSHDAPGSCGFRLDTPDGSVGVLTDTGYVTDEAAEVLQGVDLAVLEANHDVETLCSGPYPYYSEAAHPGRQGHLSNEDAARFAARPGGERRVGDRPGPPEPGEQHPRHGPGRCGDGPLPPQGWPPCCPWRPGTAWGPSTRSAGGRMQKVTVLCVGKLKERFYLEAAAEYAKRLSRYCKLEILELPEERLPEDPSPAQIEAALAKEAAAVRGKLPAGAALIALCVEGELRSSEDLARLMAAWASQGAGQLVFLIGGSFGLHPSLKAEARLRLSMSPMTFPHHLARVMLLEQIYRAYQINAGTKYHK